MQIACPESQGLLYEFLGRWFVKRAQLEQQSTTRARRAEHSTSSGASGSNVPVGDGGGLGQTGSQGHTGVSGVAHVFDRLICIGEGVASEFGIGALSALSQDAQHGVASEFGIGALSALSQDTQHGAASEPSLSDDIGNGGGTGGTGGAQRGALGDAPSAQNDALRAAAAAAAAGALLPSSAAAAAGSGAGSAAHTSLLGNNVPKTALIGGAEPNTALRGGTGEAGEALRIAPTDTAPACLSRWQLARQLTLGAGRSLEIASD